MSILTLVTQISNIFIEAKLETLEVPACAHSIQLFQSLVGPTKFENIFFKRAKLRVCPYAHISNNIQI